MNKVLVIFGSSRSDGNTRELVDNLFNDREVEIIDLLKHDISYYDYEHRNRDDDFVKIAEKILESDVIVFATPVYWYSMSAPMKTFFDRITDLMYIRKEMGRSLAGKKVFLVVCAGGDMPEFFPLPFSKTANYLDMEFIDYFKHSGRSDFDEKEAKKFVDRIFEEANKEGEK